MASGNVATSSPACACATEVSAGWNCLTVTRSAPMAKMPNFWHVPNWRGSLLDVDPTRHR